MKVWDYQNKSCVQTLEGHSQNVSVVCFHPELPVILSGSEDGKRSQIVLCFQPVKVSYLLGFFLRDCQGVARKHLPAGEHPELWNGKGVGRRDSSRLKRCGPGL